MDRSSIYHLSGCSGSSDKRGEKRKIFRGTQLQKGIFPADAESEGNTLRPHNISRVYPSSLQFSPGNGAFRPAFSFFCLNLNFAVGRTRFHYPSLCQKFPGTPMDKPHYGRPADLYSIFHTRSLKNRVVSKSQLW